MTSHFSSLGLPVRQLANLEQLGYQTMTPIQAQSLPHVLAGRDVIAKAKTGSGKTAAFAIGLLEKLNPRFFGVQGLILCPTRELSSQVAKEIRRLARYRDNIKVLTLCGGQPIGPQIGSLEHGAHVVVGTPGRIQDHLRKGTLVLDGVNTLVMDEADRMLDMGFIEPMEAIASLTPADRQTLLFSATYPEGIQQLSARFQRDPIEVSVEAVHKSSQIEQLFYPSARDEKGTSLARLLSHYHPESCVVFCNTKQQCRTVTEDLESRGFSAQALHGDLEQRDRDLVLVRFANGSSNVLVATDVAARGLDISELQAVINYDLSPQADIYVHRIGRTGRAGREGLALSLFTESERHRLDAIAEYQGQPVKICALETLPENEGYVARPSMVTFCIDGGRKNKVRPGDILGALTGEAGIAASEVGKIDITDFHAYVAVTRTVANKAFGQLQNGKIKGRKFRVRRS